MARALTPWVVGMIQVSVWVPQSGRWYKVKPGMCKCFKGEGATGHRYRRGPSHSCLPATARWITDVVLPDVLFRVQILKKVLG